MTQVEVSTQKRAAAVVNAYLILKQDEKILLGMRKNTGYGDGMWSLPAGHVEDAEGATSAMVREANEELCITIHRDEVKVVHVMHLRTNRLNVAIFFKCESWDGKIQNTEPEKCEKLEFFPLAALPPNIIPHQVHALNAIAKGEFYSELGF
ncbi:MAG: NUDIX domain-containing protein [Candidatus Melainabacteria bacterium]|nr:NUDIX domain-containing protein [Candidatus Melainabacteria bacterium]